MATSLVGQSIGSTYRQLAHVDGGVDGTEKPLLDGDGTQTPLELSTDNVDISTHNGTNKGLKITKQLVAVLQQI